ncbi:T9SS type A sorting domain-containing protein [Kordia sp.]|uniref:T9SS type A sorting domain-containing protein n=1 Tax=Kordia sp. TaxID=1965332 RepID=UPI003B5B16EE
MRKITFKIFMIMFLLGAYVGVSQTLNQAASWPNAAWTLSGTYTAGGLASDPTGAGTTFTWDDDAAGNGSGDNIIATSPVIDLTAASGAGETWITVASEFTYRALGGDVLIIETYDADAMTWSTLHTFAGNATVNDYQTCINTEAYTTPVLDISGFTATQLAGFQYRISYDDQGGWQWGWCVTSPTITSAAPPSCIDPSMLTATNIADTTADLGWTENGTAMVWDIEIVTSGSAATGTPTASGVANPYMATALTADTAYDFYVRADCGGAGTSNWVGPFTFTTACAAIAAPYSEDFETFTTAGTAFGAENCWTGSGGVFYWESAPGTDAGSGGTGPDPSITTGNYFYTEASNGTTGDTTDLLSPLVDLTALTAPALTFNYHMFGGQIGTLDVLVNGTTNVWTLSGQQQASATAPWELAVVDLAAYAGQSITITFRATSAGTFEGDISIDNVSFTELPACSTPNALGATMITDTTADLAWTENGTATAWDIEIVDITGGGMATGTPTASGVTNPYTAMGLTQNNDYTFYVRSDCGGGTFSTWAGPFAFSTIETCPTPSALTATNIMETTADLGWTENGAATSWNIELVDITAGGTATGTPTASGVMNPYMATGLVGDNNYEFYVQADCGMDGVSAWAGPFAFATPYVAVPPTCSSGIFLDSGGMSGDYSSGEDITYTICPDMAGDAVNVEFTFFSSENNGAAACYDGLTVHDGADAMATTIDPPGGGTIWCWDRNDTPAAGTGDLQGMTITSSDASGCLTFVFTSDGSVTRPGWQGNITCAPLSVESAETRGFLHYVNTANNSFVVNAQTNVSSIEVYNIVGQAITSVKPNANTGEAFLGSAKNGIYFAKVTLENGRSSVVKFVK